MDITEEIQHYDKLGQRLNVGDFVAWSSQYSLAIGKIAKFTPKMIKVSNAETKTSKTINKYSGDCILLDNKLVTLWVLKNSQ